MPILGREPEIFPQNLLDGYVDPTGQRQWWVLYTKARQEKAVARSLFSGQTPFFLPLTSKDHVARGRKRTSLVPVFGGYMFLFGNEEERVRSLATNRLSKVIPVANQAELFADLKQVAHLIQSGAALTVERRIEPGQRVRVKSGAFMGVEGTVISRLRQTRLLVAVRLLQQGVSVEIDDYLLEPIG
jgi:transcriptional antiterminator RfaH